MRSRLLPWLTVLPMAAAAVCCAPPVEDNPPEPPDPDERFFGAEPCPAPPEGVAIEESAAFTAGGAPRPLLVLMGGGPEVESAAIRFAEAAQGGDLLVLRATGSTSSYTSWFAEELALEPRPGAVATVLIEDPGAGADDAVLCRVARADALWLAGGDQRDYLLGWPAALHQSFARAIARGVAVGGTSAGAMSLSEHAFDAAFDSVDSANAMAGPLDDVVSLSPSPLAAPALAGFLVDTHFDARARLGRLVTFLARAAHDGTSVTGLGLDEETALVIADGRVEVSGAADAWLVSLDEAPLLAEGVALDALAHVAPLSRQSAWPPLVGAEAPGARAFVVVDGVAQ